MQTVAETLGYLAIATIVMLAAAIPAGFSLMLLLGALHASITAAVPAIGFTAAYPIALFLGWTAGFLRPASRRS